MFLEFDKRSTMNSWNNQEVYQNWFYGEFEGPESEGPLSPILHLP